MNDDSIEKLEELRNVINSSILCKQDAWNKKDEGNWDKLWSAFDNIEDAQLAINEYDFHKNSRVFIFGVMQALIVQQDAIKHLSEAVGLKPVNFKKDSKFGKIRKDKNINTLVNFLKKFYNMKNINQLDKLRKKIDIVDDKLVYLLAERFKITKEIILLKKKNGISVKDKNREDFILKETANLAKKLKINTEFVADIFKKILKESKK